MEGLEKFREAFEAYSENYVIIGGTACDIALTGTTVRPRATHDIDMIVIVEKMTGDFAEHFWQFVREGGYRPEVTRLPQSFAGQGQWQACQQQGHQEASF